MSKDLIVYIKYEFLSYIETLNKKLSKGKISKKKYDRLRLKLTQWIDNFDDLISKEIAENE
jgi:hypothetical protein